MSTKKKDDEGWVGGHRIYPDSTKKESSSDDDWLNQDYGFDSFRKPKSRTINTKEEE